MLCIFTAILSFRGSIQYTLYAKNSSSPAFLWYPSYDAVRYSVKTFIAGVCAYVKFNPKVSMPVCICGFASLALLTYRYQPCQGQGRVANNLRTMGFSMGAWISICGLTAVACNANRNIVNTAAVVGSYAVLLGGTAVVALASWRLNDAKAKQLSLPDTPLEKMLESSQTVYVRKVAASAYLHFAENVKSFDEVDARVLETIGGHLGLNATDFSSDAIYVRLRLCAAYLLMSTVMGASVSSSAVSDGPMKYNLRTIKNSIQDAARGSCIPHYFHRFSKMICCSGKVIPSLEMRTFVVRRKELVFSVKDCLEVVVNALAKRGKSITRIDQARIANTLFRHYNDHVSGKVDGDHCAPRDDPVYLDAVGKAHIYQIAKEVRDLQGSAENILSGLNFLNRLLSRLSLSYEETYPMHAFQSHFFSIVAGEIEIRSDFAHPLVSLFHMILCWERLREMHEKSLQDGYFKDMIRDVRDAVSSNFKTNTFGFKAEREEKVTYDDVASIKSLLSSLSYLSALSASSFKDLRLMGLGLNKRWLHLLDEVAVLAFSTNYQIHTVALSILQTIVKNMDGLWDAVLTANQEFAKCLEAMKKSKASINSIVDTLLENPNRKSIRNHCKNDLQAILTLDGIIETGNHVNSLRKWTFRDRLRTASRRVFSNRSRHASRKKSAKKQTKAYIFEANLAKHLMAYTFNLLHFHFGDDSPLFSIIKEAEFLLLERFGALAVYDIGTKNVWIKECDSVSEAFMLGAETQTDRMCDREWRELIQSTASPERHLPWLKAWLPVGC